MRRLILLLLVAASLLVQPGPARAQATADQLNRLSLEALTAPSPGGGGGYSRRANRSYGYRAVRTRRPSYRRSFGHRSVGRSSYHRRTYRSARSARPARGYGARRYVGRHHDSHRYAPTVHRRRRY